jgi:hypothetical protein
MRWKWLLILLIAFGAWHHWQMRPDSTFMTAGAVIAENPMQKNLDAPIPLQRGDYRIQPLAEFSIKARVLGVERYYLGREADLSPVDLALGWGAMSDPAVLRQIQISQSSRFYYWYVNKFPIPREEIETYSANMHMIPANGSIADQLSAIRPGQIIRLHGYLVEAHAGDNWRWSSSLRRDDTGRGACELVWVESLEKL